ncbi:phosphoglycolate phosphatase [Psychromonas ingrahamii 37]|uniref:Phosphoglycolate phosphatase n=1 Tax=Psychromonas ingrahamii (strain DSM 17664 / CCUG 51855 / 37) TaxID=357804 RepID=A1SUR2_PSYIN|nr:phosphoglycolate phosphatase [Psychromonas ingrahamii]ABM03227.1 phosphoglycolate phosphatase [Psychromonas ingrahamii 37]
MKFTSKEVILFDLDGTLIDSAPDLSLAVNHMLSALQRPTFEQDIIRSWVGNGAEVLVKRGLSGQDVIDENIDPDLVEKSLQLFFNFYKKNLCVDTKLYPSVRACLKILKAKGYRLVIVTNKPFEFIEPILEGLELTGLFEMLLGGDSLEKRKPDALPLLHVCEKLSVTVEQCLMVGDSKNDILAAKAAKMESIGLTYGYNYGEDISRYNPEAVFDDFSDIVATLS